jgi:uncharacterized protein
LYPENSLQSPASANPVSEPAVVHDDNSLATSDASGVTSSRQRSAGSWLLLILVRMYVIFLSPFLGGACRFYPSCSNYAREAIERHGARLGTVLALKRLLRCHPFTPGGVDLVPDELPSAERGYRTSHSNLAPVGQGRSGQGPIRQGNAQ